MKQFRRHALAVAIALASLLLPATPPAAAADGVFAERAAELGLAFTHDNGLSGEFYFPEVMGGGAALLDYDSDGDLDLYLVQSGPLVRAAGDPPPPGDRLFRNDLGEDGEASFTDVTAEAGLGGATGYGMGVASGDYDGDGHPDLYVLNFGSNQLWRNRGDGSFEDVTAGAGADDPGWSVGATFFDYDRDGDLDLFVVDYVSYDPVENPACYAPSSHRDFCGPYAFPSQTDRLLRNRGDGTFEDTTARAGIAAGAPAGAGLGVVAADLDGDGWIDLYVANDGQPNHLWLNRGDGSFVDDALLAGVAFNRDGAPEASMGVDAGDFDDDGDLDLFLTHLSGETNTLYVNQGGGVFSDRSVESGLATGSLPLTGFGTAWFDYDNDGRLDLLTANGAVRILEELVRQGDEFPLDQPNQLFRNLGDGRFEAVGAAAGGDLARPEVSRGAAFGDLDNDGDTDVVITNSHGPVRLLINRTGNRRPWLGLRLVGEPGGRDQLGAVVEVARRGAPALWRRVHTDGSYAAASDPRVLVGLGAGAPVTALRVHWPDGSRETFPPPPLGVYTTLRRGSAPAAGAGSGGDEAASR